MKRTSRAPSVLSKSVHHQLKMYALAAGAAGVGALALSQAAEAKIVYTAAHLVLHRGDDPGLTKLDLNHDGVIDFTFSNFWVSGTRGTQPSGRLSVLPAQAENGIRVNISSDYFAAALQAGVSVGKNGELFAPARADMDFGNRNAGGCAGPWKNAKDRYLGMKFIIKGKLHFGWARLNVSCNPHNSQTTAVVTGYAYETIPGKSIRTGATKGPDDGEPTASFTMPTSEPATLGILAMGSPGLSVWRRKERAQSTQ
jgi:hypothetical protein